MARMDELCDDLLAETADLDRLLGALDATAWDTPTPAPGWSVRDQVTHLAWFDDRCRQAIERPDDFRAHREEATGDVDAFVESVAAAHRERPGRQVRHWFTAAREALVDTARPLDPSMRTPWYGPDMSLASSITARLMETWAHGQDVADALGVRRPVTDRLRHVAFLGVRALPNSFLTHGLPVPAEPVRIDLGLPGGERWTMGPDDAADVVRGPALDFCLVVTRRRHVDDTALHAEGAVATEWLRIAQAFAGPPGPGREPGQHQR